ncbi:MAG: tetratricopeptide repeat protein [Candidatus Lokiarchaeota archaeon]|nr:tetratricopeptide repeat protein [Candidatus Lokiarchaeota archaeon]
MKNCPFCNQEVRETDKFCIHCKKPLLTFISQKEGSLNKSLQPYNYLQYEDEDQDEEFNISEIDSDVIDRKIRKISASLEAAQASGITTGDLLLKKASLYYQKRDLGTSAKIVELALNSFDSENDLMNVAICHNELGLIQEDIGIYDEAIYQFDRAIDILKNLGDSQKLIRTYNNIANIYHLIKDFEHSYEYYKKAIDLARKENLVMEEVKSSSNLVDVLFSFKNYDSIEKILDRNAFIFNQIGDINGTIITLIKYGKLNFHKGPNYFDKALKLFTDALDLVEKISERISIYSKSQLEWECYLYIGKVYYKRKNYEKAEINILRSLESLRTHEIEDSLNQALVLKLIGKIYSAKNNFIKAVEYFDLSSITYEKFGALYDKALVKILAAQDIMESNNDDSKALNYYEDALNIFQEQGYDKEVADTSQTLGDIYIKLNLEGIALEYFEKAKDTYQILKDKFNSQLVKEKIQSLKT